MGTVLTAVAVTPDEAARIEQARDVLSRARADSFDWPHTERSRRAVTMAASDLEEALEFHGNLLSGALHPASEFPQLAAGHPDDALAQALTLAAGEITDCASALVIIVRRECSEEMAAMVSGQDRPVAA
jgi:hypothetical protein